jgi:hypothetical protein
MLLALETAIVRRLSHTTAISDWIISCLILKKYFALIICVFAVLLVV